MGKIVTIDNKADKETAFIQAYVESGDPQKAALDAGYSHGTYGYELRERLADEIREAVTKRISGVAPMALSTLAKLAENAESESVRRQAAKDIMSLGGFDIQRMEDITKKDDRSDAEIIESIKSGLASPDTPDIIKEAVREAVGMGH